MDFSITSYFEMSPVQKNEACSLKKQFEVAEQIHFWGQDYNITPVFVRGFLGNGQKFLGVSPLNTRPNYYVVRIDSSWSTSNYDEGETVGDHIDEVYDLIEEEYSSKYQIEEDEEAEEGSTADWPALDDECGSSWFEIEHPAALRALSEENMCVSQMEITYSGLGDVTGDVRELPAKP